MVIGGLGCTHGPGFDSDGNVDLENPGACNYNEYAIVDDGSCITADYYGDYCYDGEGDGYGYNQCYYENLEDNCNGLEYYCPEDIPDYWVNNCLDSEPICVNSDPEILLTDICGTCNGNNECFEYPDQFIDSWILTEQNQYDNINCYAESEEDFLSYYGPFNADFITENGTSITEECLTYRMDLKYTEPCEWIGGKCQEIDNNCSENNQELCEFNTYCIWVEDSCIESNNNCYLIDNESDCLINIEHTNLAQLVCVTNEIYDDQFGGGWIYEEELSAIFEWGVANDSLCFNDYGINQYECISYTFFNEENEIRLEYFDTNQHCNQNVYQRDSYLSINSPAIPKEYHLYSNYPNPFNPTTNISFDIPTPNYVSLDIYNIKGQHIYRLINEYLPAGHYEFKFNGTNLSSGIYFVTLRSEEFIKSNKMILIK